MNIKEEIINKLEKLNKKLMSGLDLNQEDMEFLLFSSLLEDMKHES